MSEITLYTNPRYIESRKSSRVYLGSLKTPVLTRIGDNILRWSNLDAHADAYVIQVCSDTEANANKYIMGNIELSDTSPNITLPTDPSLYDCYIINMSSTGLTSGSTILTDSEGNAYTLSVNYGEEIIYDGNKWIKLWSNKSSEIADTSGDTMQISMSTEYLPDDGTYTFRIRAVGASTYTEDIQEGDSDYVEGSTNQRVITVEFYSPWSNEIDPFTISTLSKVNLVMTSGTCEVYWDSVDNADRYTLYYQKDNLSASTMYFDSTEIPTETSKMYLDNLSEFTEIGIFTIRVVPSSSNHWFLYRTRDISESDSITYSRYKLAAPVYTGDLDTSTFTAKWSYPADASGNLVDYAGNVLDSQPSISYNVWLNNEYITNVISSTYSFKDNITDDVYSYRAYIVSTVSDQVEHANPYYINSSNSEYIDFGVLPAPSISWTSDGNIHVNNTSDMSIAEIFKIYKNGTEINALPVSESDYTLDMITPESFSVYYIASTSNENISDSVESNVLSATVNKLSAPTIRVTSHNDDRLTIRWDPISSANIYRVYVNNRVITTSSTTVTIALSTGDNSIYVRSDSSIIGISNSNLYKYLQSDISNIIYYTQEINYSYSVSITNSTYGGDYDLELPFTINHYLDETLDTASLTLAPSTVSEPFEAFDTIVLKMSMGLARVQRTESFVIEKDEVEEVMIGTNSRWLHHITCIERTKLLEEEILPDFAITQPLSFVSADYRLNNQDIVKTNITDGTTYHDPIYGDYNQNSNIITSTYITRISDLLDTSDGFWDTQFHITNSTKIMTSIYNKVLEILGKGVDATVMYTMSGLLSGNVDGELITSNTNTVYNVGNSVKLPIETGTSFNVYRKYSINYNNIGLIERPIIDAAITFGTNKLSESLPTESKNSLRDLGIKIRKTYKYRPHSSTYDTSTTETVITSYTEDSDTPKTDIVWDTSDIPAGEYDIILELTLDFTDASISEDDFKKSMHFDKAFVKNRDWAYAIKSGNDTWWKRLIGDLLLPGLSATLSFIGHYGENPVMEDMSTSKSVNDLLASKGRELFCTIDNYNFYTNTLNSTNNYRIVFGGSNLSSGITIGNDPSVYRSFEGKNVWEALEKIVTILKPLTISENSQYTLDKKLKPKLESIVCPEMIFQGGKSLFEVLLEIGRLFYGYPRLLDNNTITFRVLDNTAMQNAEAFNDADMLRKKESSIDNHSTGFVSKLSNVISKNDWIVYPSSNSWIRAKSTNDNESLMTVSNAGIVLDKPIYNIRAVLCTRISTSSDFIYSDNSTIESVIDITPYVYDSTVFNTLNANVDGKGSALYYNQGDNKIYNLGVMSESTKFDALMNWNSDQYVIHNILHKATGQSLTDIQNNYPIWSLGFKVVYQTSDNLTVYTEQSNIAGLANQSYRVLNQENNIINDKTFGQSAQTQVERLGNNSIRKVYMILNSNWDSIPIVGNFTEYSGYRYYIDEVTYQFGNEYIKTEVNLSKNFNKINERVGVNSEYRMYEIYSNSSATRNVNINEYCYISTQNYGITASDNSYKFSSTNWATDIVNSLNGNPDYYPNYFYIRPLDSTGNNLKYIPYDSTTSIYVPCSLISVQPYKFKNSIAFTGKFKDNFSTGTHMSKADSDIFKTLDGQFGNDTSRFIQSDVRYVDDAGECPVLDITLCRPSDYQMKYTLGVNSMSFPETNTVIGTGLNNKLYSQKIQLNKDNREQLELTLQMHFLTFDKRIHIHSGMVDNLFKPEDNFIQYIKQTDLKNEFSSKVLPTSVSYYACKDDLRMVDTIPSISDEIGTPIITKTSNDRVVISCSSTITAQKSYKSICLVWNDGTILYDIASNISEGDTVQIPTIYLNLSDKKLSYKVQ